MLLAPRWRLLDSGASDGATNMATDVALMARAATSGEAVLRVYAWSRPTVSLGIHERSAFTAEHFASDGLDVVRRPTGGRALLHDREVTYSVTAPIGGSLADCVRTINTILRSALAKLGVHADEAPRRRRASGPGGAACFAEPNVGEIVIAGRKLVGSAQRRDPHALLQHGSILLDDDQGRLGAPPAATLNAVLGRRVSYTEVRDALWAALTGLVGRDAVEAIGAPEISTQVADARAQFLDPKWTWRR